MALLIVARAPMTRVEDGMSGTAEIPEEELMETRTIEKVTLTTSDGKKLVGNLYAAPGGKSVILLHQLNHDKGSWDAFAKRLQRDGWTLLALDLRGHGESEGSWNTFSEKDFVAMLNDAKAAAMLLRQRDKQVVAIVGASIGANTALRYSAQNKVPAILLSPGLDYRGIDINNITSNAATLIIVGKGDEYAYASSKELEQNNLFGAHELFIVDAKEHGTYLLQDQGVTSRIISFLEEHEE